MYLHRAIVITYNSWNFTNFLPSSKEICSATIQKRAPQLDSPDQELHLVAKLKTEQDFSKKFLMSKQSILPHLIWYRALISSVDWCLRPSLFRALRLQVQECLCYYNLIFSQMVVNGKVFWVGLDICSIEKKISENILCEKILKYHSTAVEWFMVIFSFKTRKKWYFFLLVQNQYSST